MQGTAAHVRSASSLTDLKTSPKYSFELLLLLFLLLLLLLLLFGFTCKKCMGPVSLRLWISFGLK